MSEKMRAFYEAVSADSALEAELKAVIGGVDLEGVEEEAEARQAMAEAVAAFAAAHGLDLTADILEADAGPSEGVLSDDELAAVSGGGKCGCVVIGALKGCGCFIGGGARHEDNFWNSFVCPFTIGFE